jgi:hypothetical protein
MVRSDFKKLNNVEVKEHARLKKYTKLNNVEVKEHTRLKKVHSSSFGNF